MARPDFPPALAQTLRRGRRQMPASWCLAWEARGIRDMLLVEGWKELGRGSFGVSFARGNQVIKVVRIADNAAYLAFARHCRASAERFPLLPRVYRILRVRRHALVLMERLQENYRRSIPLSSRLLRWYRTGSMPYDLPQRAGRRVSHLCSVLQSTSRIRAKHRRSRWDLHEGNILFRKEGGVLRPVFSDPITY